MYIHIVRERLAIELQKESFVSRKFYVTHVIRFQISSVAPGLLGFRFNGKDMDGLWSFQLCRCLSIRLVQ